MRGEGEGGTVSRYILTGAPGAGKTAVLRLLESTGHAVVEEAATDVIALEQACGVDEPWRDPRFPDRVVRLQRSRLRRADAVGAEVVIFDRSPVCTLALSRHLGSEPSPELVEEVGRCRRLYAREVFFVRNLGFVRATAARRITLPDALAFERVHEETYREYGFRLVEVPAGPLPGRAELVERTVRRLRRPPCR
jgi:predicted ATPase